MSHATPFSFHCMICFEEFTPEDRYPVVLPCGHTYVCNVCSDRLDKCMECRTPLYTIVSSASKSAPAVTGSPSWRSPRSTSHSPPTEPPAPPVKKRLPLPKNVVLLSLIEATELASQDVRNKDSPRGALTMNETDHQSDASDRRGGGGVPGIRAMGSMIDVEDDEEEKIKMSTSLAVGVAGTYAVSAREGLDIYSSRPASMDQSTASSTLADEDVESLVRFFNDERKTGDGDGGTPKLSYGDRVQIVSVDGEWAKLARGYGYVSAKGNNLVKVGSPLDRACKLEAFLRSLSNRKKELRMEQTQIDNQFIRMLNSLQASLQKDEDLTVILADTFATIPPRTDEDPQAAAVAAQKEKIRERDAAETASDSSVQKPSTLHRQNTPPLLNTRFGCFSGDVFDEATRNWHGGGASSPNRTTAHFPNIEASALLNAFLPDHSPADISGELMPSASHPSPSAMRAGAEAWRARSGHRGIDFRTGMSGHGALMSSHAHHPHDYLEPTGGTRFRMSSHLGLTSSRAKASHSFLNAFVPTNNHHHRHLSRQQETRDQVSQAESL